MPTYKAMRLFSIQRWAIAVSLLAPIFFGIDAMALDLLPRRIGDWATPPENWETRATLRDTIEAPLIELERTRPAYYRQTLSESVVQVKTHWNDRNLYLLFINVDNGRAAIDNAGSYIIRRNRRDGSLEHIKIFLRSGGKTYISIAPNGAFSSMDVVVEGIALYRKALIPKRLRDLSTAPLSDLLTISSGLVDWETILAPIDHSRYSDLIGVIDRVRPLLPTLPDADDGRDGRKRQVGIYRDIAPSKRASGV